MAIIGEASRLSHAIGVHHVDFTVPIPIRHEGNVFIVRRPC